MTKPVLLTGAFAKMAGAEPSAVSRADAKAFAAKAGIGVLYRGFVADAFIRRFDTDRNDEVSWNEFVAEHQGQDLKTQLKEVNRACNAHKYILDINNWGEEEYWAPP